jgi:hypothetical protein
MEGVRSRALATARVRCAVAMMAARPVSARDPFEPVRAAAAVRRVVDDTDREQCA